MESVRLRIDDRLLHGQVLVAWAAALRPERIVLASDEIAADPTRRAVYAELQADDCEVAVESLAEAAVELRSRRRLLVVCGSPAAARRLVDLGAGVRRVDIGGLHAAESKRRLLDYVYLSRQDADDLRALVAGGIEVEARDLPASRGVRLDAATLERLWP